MTTLDPRALRDAFGTFMTGVTVVTTFGEDGNPRGFTANSFSSVSLDPPLLLVSIARTSQNYETFSKARGFAVNILSEGQKDVSNTFARPVADRFAAVKWHKGPCGAPVLSGVSAWFDCATHQIVEAGDHAILIGRVEGFESMPTAGLGYYRGSYFTPAETASQMPAGPDVIVSVILERSGAVLLVPDASATMTIPSARVGTEGVQNALGRLIQSTGVQAEPGFIYAVFEDSSRGQQHIAFLCPASPEGQPNAGGFVPLTAHGVEPVANAAIRSMLQRLSDESRMGNYGIYFGNQEQGRVAPIGGRKPS